MIDWNKNIERAHGMAKEKGWWDEPRSVEECLMLAVTEVAEAVEWYRDWKWNQADVFLPCRQEPNNPKMILREGDPSSAAWKPVGIPSELADVCIRVCDLMGHSRLEFDYHHKLGRDISGNFVRDCFLIACEVVGGEGYSTGEQLCRALIASEEVAARYNIDLSAAIEIKLAYNATRPHRHGGKKA